MKWRGLGLVGMKCRFRGVLGLGRDLETRSGALEMGSGALGIWSGPGDWLHHFFF